MFPSTVFVASSSSVLQNQTKNKINFYNLHWKSNMATEYQKVTLTPHSQVTIWSVLGFFIVNDIKSDISHNWQQICPGHCKLGADLNDIYCSFNVTDFLFLGAGVKVDWLPECCRYTRGCCRSSWGSWEKGGSLHCWPRRSRTRLGRGIQRHRGCQGCLFVFPNFIRFAVDYADFKLLHILN